MDEKALAIRHYLLKRMPGRRIQYQFAGELHKFRIEGEGDRPTHWLYVSRDLVEDSEPVILINLVNIYHIVDRLDNVDKSMWLFLASDGIREVDEHFAQ